MTTATNTSSNPNERVPEITLKIPRKILEDARAKGELIRPELQSSKLHMDGSVIEFLTALKSQYLLDLLILRPQGTTHKDSQDFFVTSHAINAQLGLLEYLLTTDEYNRQLQLNNTGE